MRGRGATLRPRPTLRLRLTLLYGCVFVLAGGGLLFATYALFKHGQAESPRTFSVTSGRFKVASGPVLQALQAGVAGSGNAVAVKPARTTTGPYYQVAGSAVGQGKPSTTLLKEIQRQGQSQLKNTVNFVVKRANVALKATQASDASSLLEWSAIALGAVALLSIGLAWWLSGRALRPLRTMNARAREISAENLHQRIGLDERRDELGELASTFDALLGRLEAAFESQRRFVANASHELRTPITLERTLVEVALADPDASVESLRRVCERIVSSTEEQERLLDALLTLARSEAGVAAGEVVELALVVEDVLLARESRLTGIAVESSLEPAAVSGDQALLERLVGNLLDNAIVHNGGADRWLKISTGEIDDGPCLRIANSGERVDPEAVEGLFEPFRRGVGERLGTQSAGLGLGLSIVRAVATAHGAQIDVQALPDGGLEFLLRFAAIGGRRPSTGDPEPVSA